MRDFVHYALSIGALELLPEGRKLKSGRISPYFFNSGKFKDGVTLSKLARAYAEAVHKTSCDLVFGPPYKGIPLVSTISMVLADRYSRKVGYAFWRKEAKDHGEEGFIVGDSLEGKLVTIADDVITTGGSFEEACKIVHEEGGKAVGAVIGFNRQERGADGSLSAVEEFEKKYNLQVDAAGTLDELIEELQNFGNSFPKAAETLPKILAYREKYGIAA